MDSAWWGMNFILCLLNICCRMKQMLEEKEEVCLSIVSSHRLHPCDQTKSAVWNAVAKGPAKRYGHWDVLNIQSCIWLVSLVLPKKQSSAQLQFVMWASSDCLELMVDMHIAQCGAHFERQNITLLLYKKTRGNLLWTWIIFHWRLGLN